MGLKAHRGELIKERLQKRRNVRRSRRNRKVRYRKARFKNRRRVKGWLPPSLISRILNVYNWGKKLIKLSPIACIEVETARFDTQKLISFHIRNKIPTRYASRVRNTRVFTRKMEPEMCILRQGWRTSTNRTYSS